MSDPIVLVMRLGPLETTGIFFQTAMAECLCRFAIDGHLDEFGGSRISKAIHKKISGRAFLAANGTRARGLIRHALEHGSEATPAHFRALGGRVRRFGATLSALGHGYSVEGVAAILPIRAGAVEAIEAARRALCEVAA